MSELSLKIKADFDEASRQFKILAEESESTRAKIEKFTEKFKTESVDKFIDSQKLAGIAITAAKDEMSAMTAQQSAYQREIERLIKSGLDPESEAVKKLKTEYDKVSKGIEDSTAKQKAHEKAVAGAEKAMKALTAAMAAAAAAMATMVQKTAEAGDNYAKTSRIIGITAETLQELEFAAKQSGISGEMLKGSLEKLNKGMGDLKTGSGALQSYLEKNDKSLLANLKSAKSNEEAFSLLMDGIKRAPDSFQKAALAQAAFGKSGQELINFAETGADGIAALREEARKYGIISNDLAAESEKYIEAQGRLKQAF